jgi:hypothetical protein
MLELLSGELKPPVTLDAMSLLLDVAVPCEYSRESQKSAEAF